MLIDILEILEIIGENIEREDKIKIRMIEREKRLIIYINGCQEINDYIKVIQNNSIEYNKIRYHEGVVKRYDELKRDNNIKKMFRRIEEYDKLGYKIELVGHSIGGGLIILLGKELYEYNNKIKIKIYTIGAFRLIEDKSKIKYLEVYRVINKNDIVRRINNKKLEHIGKKIEIENKENKNKENHSIYEYIDSIKRILKIREYNR